MSAPMHMLADPPLSLRETAEALRVDRKTVERYIAKGLLRAAKPAGRWIVRRSAVEDFLNGDMPPERVTA